MINKFPKSIRIEAQAGGMSYSCLRKVVKLIVLLTGNQTYRTGAVVLLTRILRLWSINRRPFLVKYLKVCYLSTVNSIAGTTYVRDNEPIVSLDKWGFPRIIPKVIRMEFSNKKPTEVDWSLVQMTLSIFNLYRVIQIPGKLKLETITDPFKGISESLDPALVRKGLEILTGRTDRKITMRWEFHHSSNSGPNAKVSTIGIWADIVAWFSQPLSFWASAFKLVMEFRNRMYFLQFLGWNLLSMLLTLPFWYKLGRYPYRIGKLVEKEEGAGKIRVFAITDWWTQSLLLPLHKGIYRILQTLPMDGTFDQTASLKRSQEIAGRRKTAWSYDLSAATDRLPLKFQKQVIGLLTNDVVAHSWGEILVSRDWWYKDAPLRYSVGQPIGALSSWGAIAISHHVIVQIAALMAGWTSRFEDYSVLGDDVVVFDRLVAENYLKIISTLGVEINLRKSVISTESWFEFAKRFMHADIDVSPLGAKALLLATRSSVYVSVSVIDAALKGAFDISDARETLSTISTEKMLDPDQIDPIYIGLFGPGGIASTKPSLIDNTNSELRLVRGIPSIVERTRVTVLQQIVEDHLSDFYCRVYQQTNRENPIDFWSPDIGKTKLSKVILEWAHPVCWWWSFKYDTLREEMSDFAHWRSLAMADFEDAKDDYLGLKGQYRALIQVDLSKYEISFGKSSIAKNKELLDNFGMHEQRSINEYKRVSRKWLPASYRV